jgi:hypothetical protein
MTQGTGPHDGIARVDRTGTVPTRARLGPAFDAAIPLRGARRAPASAVGLLIAGCGAIAALSLLLPSALTYDPLAWLIWGREIVHLDLSTTFGPSWKPLPVAIDTVLSFTGAAAPWLWLLVTRTGGLLALAGSYRLASRLGGRPAGVIAAVALALSREWLRDSWLGNSEGLLLALTFFAVERHLDGRPKHALVLGFFAALLRPEVWPFLGLYGIWLWVREPALRRLSLLLAALIPLLWFVPEAIGSGEPFRAATRAKAPAPGSNVPALSEHPVSTLLSNSRHVLIQPALWGAAIALVLYLWRPWRREWVTFVLGLWALAWLGLVAAMTGHGYSGNARYLIAPGGLACVVAGVGWARLGGEISSRVRLPFVGLALALVLAAGSLPWIVPRINLLRIEGRMAIHESHIDANIDDAVRLAGGGDRVRRCGGVYTGPFEVPVVAHQLNLHFSGVALDPRAPGTVFQTRVTPASPLGPRVPAGFRYVGAAGPWRVYTTCAS